MIRSVNVESKTNISEIFSVTIIRVDAENDHISPICIPVCQNDASTYLMMETEEISEMLSFNSTLMRHSLYKISAYLFAMEASSLTSEIL
jgi:hypothetical protein